MSRHTAMLLSGLSLISLSVGCESQLTGNDGNFQFSYPADDRVLDFNKPIAVGAKLDIEVTDVGARDDLEISGASSADDAVLTVDSFSGNAFTLLGTGAGNVLLTVTGTTAAGDELTDSVNMGAKVPEVHKLAHTCDGGTRSAYLTGQDIWVPFEFEMANSQPVIGYGYYPVTASDESVLSIDPAWEGSQYMKFTTGSAGDITLTSDLDGSAIELNVIAEADIDGVGDPTAFVLEDIDVGDVNAFYVLPTVGELTVCQADVTFTVTSDTPDICDVRTTDDALASGDALYEYGWFEVEGKAAGECSYTVAYPNSTVATSAQFTYTIEP